MTIALTISGNQWVDWAFYGVREQQPGFGKDLHFFYNPRCFLHAFFVGFCFPHTFCVLIFSSFTVSIPACICFLSPVRTRCNLVRKCSRKRDLEQRVFLFWFDCFSMANMFFVHAAVAISPVRCCSAKMRKDNRFPMANNVSHYQCLYILPAPGLFACFSMAFDMQIHCALSMQNKNLDAKFPNACCPC